MGEKKKEKIITMCPVNNRISHSSSSHSLVHSMMTRLVEGRG